MQKSIYKKGSVITETILDNEGEVISSTVKQHAYIANSKEEFMFIYSSMLGVFMDMEKSEIRVYGYLLRYSSGVKFSVDKAIRIDIAESTGLNERTVYNTIKMLEDKFLIYKVGKLYVINPRYAFKGGSSERNAALKATIELGCKDC